MLRRATVLQPLSSAVRSQQDSNAPIVFRADEIEYDDQLAPDSCSGHVEISQSGQVLLADTVSYNQRTDTVTASGNVSLSQPTGEIVFADFMELRDSMSKAFAKNVRMLLADRSRLAANTARRTNGNRTELQARRLLPLRPVPGRPERAARLAAEGARNRPRQGAAAHRVSRRRHGDRRMAGLLLALHVDARPLGKRASGFLPPSVGSSNTLGAHITIPYFWCSGPTRM